MSISQRRLLFITFTLIFGVFSLSVILYASGYRYNTRLRRIEQVGLLSISTIQEGSTAIVNGLSHSLKRDLLLSSLEPGDYEMVLVKDGYHPWTKQLPVVSGRTTFAQNIRLFPDTPPEPNELFANPLQAVARNTIWRVYRGNDTLVVLQLDNHEIREIDLPQTGAIEKPEINTAGFFVFSQANDWFLLDLEDKTLTFEPLIVPEQSLRILPGVKRLHILTAANRVWEWSNETLTPLFNLAEAQTIVEDGNHWYAIAADPTHKRSELYAISGVHVRSDFIAAFPYAADFSLASTVGPLLLAADHSNHNLYLVDTSVVPAKSISLTGVHTWQWSADAHSLLTASNNELAIYHVDNGLAQELIVRQSETMTGAVWGPEESWVIYSTADAIYAAERDSRDERNVITLARDLTNPQLLAVTKNNLLFSAQEGNNFILWSLPFEL